MTEKNQAKIGDVVRLKSGGPTMTVVGHPSKASASTELRCAYFERQFAGATAHADPVFIDVHADALDIITPLPEDLAP